MLSQTECRHQHIILGEHPLSSAFVQASDLADRPCECKRMEIEAMQEPGMQLGQHSGFSSVESVPATAQTCRFDVFLQMSRLGWLW